MSSSYHNTQNWLLLSLLTLIWGSSYILIKKGLIAFTPLELASLRIAVSFVCALPFAVKAWKTVSREKLPTIFQIGIFGSGAPAFLFALSMTHSGSAINGIINSLSPLWTLVIGYYLFSIGVTASKVAGIVIGFMGAVVLVLGKTESAFGSLTGTDLFYSLLPVAATFCYGMSTNITKQKLQNENPLYTTSIAMFMIGVPATVIFLAGEAPAKILAGTAWFPLLSIVALSVLGTFVAWILFYRLVQRTDALFAASVTYLIPIVAMGWGFFDGEVLGLVQLFGLALILAGVALVSKKEV
ncbi:MAG: DMT family transporter [Chitinophagales bacterium]|nr:DMT family transporter [Chitinophagales bacterium]